MSASKVEDVTRLRTEFMELMTEVTELRTENTKLRSEVTELRTENTELGVIVNKLRTNIKVRVDWHPHPQKPRIIFHSGALSHKEGMHCPAWHVCTASG